MFFFNIRLAKIIIIFLRKLEHS